VAVKGNLVFRVEGVSGVAVLIETEVKEGGDPIVAVERNTKAVANQDEEEIEEEFMVGETLPEAISQETVFDGGEAPFDPAHPFGDEGCFMPQGVVPVAWRNG